MECLNCLSNDAEPRRPKGWQWLIAPIVWPIRCERCIRWYFYPTFLVLFEYRPGHSKRERAKREKKEAKEKREE